MANLVKNGYFKTPTITATDFNAITSSTNFTNWNLVVANEGGSYMAKNPNNIIYGPSGLPTSSGIAQFVGFENNHSGIQQTISFPYTGNYVLSFWVATRAGSTSNQKGRCRLGSFLDVSFAIQKSIWTNISVPFYTKEINPLFIISPDITTTYFIMVAGVSIVSTDYTLDLFLEWIPDEYVEEQHKNIKNKEII